MIATTEAVRLAAEATAGVYREAYPGAVVRAAAFYPYATAAVAAALPALAEQFAALIEAQKHSPDMHLPAYPSGGVCVHCARPKGHNGWHSCMPTIDDDLFDLGGET